jgi:hypothetical protein
MRLLALGLVLAVAGIGATNGPRATLRAIDLEPLTLRGASFKPSERVKLLVAAPKPSQRVVRADARGRFRVVLALAVDGCDAVVVQAIGARGSRAAFRHDALDCASP